MIRSLKRICLTAAAFVATSCVVDRIPSTPTNGEEAVVRFNVRTPAPVRTGTRAPNENFENGINSVVVLVAKSDGAGGFNVSQMIRVADFTQTTRTTATFSISLISDPAPTKFMLITNLAQGMYNTLDSFAIPGISETEVRSRLDDTFLYSIYGNPQVMTMTGDVTLPSGISPAQTINVEIPLLRMTARFDLYRNLTADSPGFEPTVVWIRRAQVRSQLFPDTSAIDPADHARVTAASLPDPDDNSSIYSADIGGADSSTGLFANIYIPESAAQTTPDGQLNSATCLIIGGKYNGSGEVSYYRVDFNSGQPGHPFGQILRNHIYSFNITKVTSAGYSSVDAALANPSSAMRVEVTAWNEIFSDIGFVDKTERKVNVLSLSDGAGSMGVWYNGGETTPTGGAMRQILTDPAWFGPGGTVDFAGFTFDEFQVENVTASSPVNLDRLTRALTSTDILIVPYACDPNAAACDLIKLWLTDPHHVMFLSCDAGIDDTPGEATNVTLRTALGDGLTWHSVGKLGDQTVLGGVLSSLFNSLFGVSITSTETTVDGLMTADSGGANTPFTDGPFGAADQSQLGHASGGSYELWDQTGEWATPPDNATFVPLAVFRVTMTASFLLLPTRSETQKTNMSLLGIDPSRRVVYLGKSEFVNRYLTSTPPNPGGEPLTPRYNNISTLMCNTWAWAVRKVLAD